jgi:hypothetical protein
MQYVVLIQPHPPRSSQSAICPDPMAPRPLPILCSASVHFRMRPLSLEFFHSISRSVCGLDHSCLISIS